MSQPPRGDCPSLWMGTTDAPGRPAVRANTRYDVLIVGGGIVGVATAYALRSSGLTVALVEAGRILSDVTGHTTGKLTSQHDLIYKHLLNTFGFDFATAYFEANEWAISFVAETSVVEKIDCDFVWDAAHVYCADPGNLPRLAEEQEACQKLNIPAKNLQFGELILGMEGAIQMPRQARFHPRKFLLAIAERAETAGVSIFEQSRVTEVRETPNGCEVETEHGLVNADQVVVATHYPIHDSGLFVAKLAPYRSYAMAVAVEGPLPEGMYISYEDAPLRSFRRAMFHEREVLIVGGEKHKVGQEADTHACYSRLESWARQNFDVREILFTWSTQDNWTPDRVPYIGRSPNRDRIYIATGFGGWGMTTGIFAGRLLADLITDVPNHVEDVYRPSRMDVAMVGPMIKENVNAASHLIGDRLHKPEPVRIDQLTRGEAAVIQTDAERLCAYRDAGGDLHVVSSACTHWGCQVKWNSAETTWDCPCHGSRFDIDGNVMHGPAVRPLEKRALTHEVDIVAATPQTALETST